MPDPYCWPGTDCLRNKLDIRDAELLRQLEGRIVSVRDVEVATSTIPGEYGLGHLTAFHARLFGDIYDWAGATRTVDIAKPGSRFCHWRFVDEQVRTVLQQLPADGWLTGLGTPHASRTCVPARAPGWSRCSGRS